MAVFKNQSWLHSRERRLCAEMAVEKPVLCLARKEIFQMNLKELSDGELWIKTQEAARTEKAATVVLLDHLAEVQRRRLFALRGFGSLFQYVVQALGYSEAQASDRIGAMRLINQVSEVKEKIQGGSLSLTTAAQIQRFFRGEKKHAEKEFSNAEKLGLVAECAGRPKRVVEQILLEKSETPVAPVRDSERKVGGQTTELKFAISSEAQKMLDEVRAREGHDLTLGLIFERSLASHLEKLNRKTDKPRREIPSKEVARPGESARVNAHLDGAAPERTRSRYIRKASRHATAARSLNQCEYVDPLSGRRCESRYRLQLDHQIPFGLGGSNEAPNLRHLCPVHNQLRAIQVFGRLGMARHVPDLE